MVLALEDCVQFKEEVQTTLDDLIQGQKEAQAEANKILDCPTVREAQQLLLIHQVREAFTKKTYNKKDSFYFVCFEGRFYYRLRL